MSERRRRGRWRIGGVVVVSVVVSIVGSFREVLTGTPSREALKKRLSASWGAGRPAGAVGARVTNR
ncbi:hypothetical protein GCM10023258_08480 [Terrabacter aeriphilus]|uniref:Uncharacterized protein n=1 Tax=Terrabacter aeriphilus TaxID=515662 RepID=A0ABP9J654_9MICO